MKPQKNKKQTAKPQQSESALQINCVKWFDYQYPHYRLNLFSIPNEGARTKKNGARMKMQGRRRGVADMFLAVSNITSLKIGLFIEFKTMTGKQKKEQHDFELVVTAQGYDYEIVRDFDTFINVINQYLNN